MLRECELREKNTAQKERYSPCPDNTMVQSTPYFFLQPSQENQQHN